MHEKIELTDEEIQDIAAEALEADIPFDDAAMQLLDTEPSYEMPAIAYGNSNEFSGEEKPFVTPEETMKIQEIQREKVRYGTVLRIIEAMDEMAPESKELVSLQHLQARVIASSPEIDPLVKAQDDGLREIVEGVQEALLDETLAHVLLQRGIRPYDVRSSSRFALEERTRLLAFRRTEQSWHYAVNDDLFPPKS